MKVLRPYVQPPSILSRIVRNTVLYSLCIFLGLFYGFACALLPLQILLYFCTPIVLLLLVVIWLLPDARGEPSRLLAFLLFAFVVVLIWPNYLAIYIPGLPWLSARRIVLFPMALSFLIGYSTSPLLRQRLRGLWRGAPELSWLVTLFAAIEILSTVTGSNLIAGFNHFGDHLLNWTLIFYVSLYVASFSDHIERWVNRMVVVVTVLAVIGVLEYANRRVLWVDHIPSFLQVDPSITDALVQGVYRNGYYRASGPYAVALSFAEMLAMLSPFLLYYFFNSKKLIVKLAAVVADVIVVAATIFTQARLGMMGLLVAHAAYPLYWAVRSRRLNKINPIPMAVALAYPAGVVAIVGAINFVGRLRSLFFGNSAYEANSTAGRWDQAEKAIPHLLRRPFFGYGPGNGAEILGWRQPNGLLTIDSSITSTALDYGMIGFVIFFALIIVGMYQASKIAFQVDDKLGELAAPLAISLAVYLVLRVVLAQQDNQFIMFMALGILAAIVAKVRATSSVDDHVNQKARAEFAEPKLVAA